MKLQSLQLYSFGLFTSGRLPATLAASGLDWLGRYQRDFSPFIYALSNSHFMAYLLYLEMEFMLLGPGTSPKSL